MFQPCYWLGITFIADGGCSSAEWDWFQGAVRFQNADVVLETCHFRKVSVVSLIWTCMSNSSCDSCLEVGDHLSFRCLLQHVAYLK